jgi:hypothetical protein
MIISFPHALVIEAYSVLGIAEAYHQQENTSNSKLLFDAWREFHQYICHIRTMLTSRNNAVVSFNSLEDVFTHIIKD